MVDNDLPREKREMLEICAKDFMVTLRLYEENSASSSFEEGGGGGGGGISADKAAMLTLLPSRRLTGTAQDLLVTFGRTFNPHNHRYHRHNDNEKGGIDSHGRKNDRNVNFGRRRKVLGSWTSSERPRDVIQPMFQLSLVGYSVDNSSNSNATSNSNSNTAGNVYEDQSSSGAHLKGADETHRNDLEYRVYVRLLPIRVYLDDYIVSFCKRLVPASHSPSQPTAATGEKKKEEENNKPELANNLTYFQSVTLASTEIKVDYRASEVNLRALQAGRYEIIIKYAYIHTYIHINTYTYIYIHTHT